MNSEQVKQLINKLNVLKKASQKDDMKIPSEENFQNQKKPTPYPLKKNLKQEKSKIFDSANPSSGRPPII